MKLNKLTAFLLLRPTISLYCVCEFLTLVLADSYMSPSTFRAYATRFSMRRSLSAAGSGVGNMACTLLAHMHRKDKELQLKYRIDLQS